jgi:iron complex outermembrane recepter protein
VPALHAVRRIARHLLAPAIVVVSPAGAGPAEPIAGDEIQELQEVIVTAQFRRENLQQVPISVTAVNAEEMTRWNMTTLSEVGKAVPNVTLQPGGTAAGKSVLAFIRGVGSGDYNFTVEPGVAVYVDDVYLSGQFGNEFDLLDLDRIEVLRGPQGTLFGKNAIGGAIRIVSRKPQGDGSGALELTVGDFSRKEARGFIDVPLVRNSVSLRLSAASKQRDGFVERLDFACVHPDLGGVVDPAAPYLIAPTVSGRNCKAGTTGGENVQSARAALRWQQSESLDVNFIADWMNDHSEPAAQSLLAVNDSAGSPLNNPFGGFNAQVAVPLNGIPYDSRFVPASIYQSYDTFRLLHVGPSATFPTAAATGTTSVPASNAVETYGVSASIEAQLPGAVLMKSITAYRGYSGTFSQDVDGSPITVVAQTNVLDHHQFSQEFQFLGRLLNGHLDWVAGLFYFDSFSLNRGPVTLAAYSWLQPNVDFTQNDPSNIRDRAAFGQATWHLTPRLSLSLGARYTHEHKDYTFRHYSYDPSVPDLVPETPTEVNYGKPSGRAAIEYQWTPQVMAYLSVSSAFRAGGFNGRPFDASQVISFGPETLVATEAGIKTEAFDRRLRVNVAAFVSRYKDLQLPVFELDATGTPFSATVNQGRAQITGGEFEFDLLPIADLRISGTLGLNHYENKELGTAINCNAVAGPIPTPMPNANCTLNGPLPGAPLPSLPERTASLAAQYTVRLPGGSSLTPGLDASFQSRTYFDPVGSAEASVPARTLLNGRLTWDSRDTAWQVALSATNLTNEQYFQFKDDLRGILGTLVGHPGPPLEWSVSVRRSVR